MDQYTGKIYVAKALDRETGATITLNLKVTEASTPTMTATQDLVVTLTDVNDITPTCDPSFYHIDKLEDSITGMCHLLFNNKLLFMVLGQCIK